MIMSHRRLRAALRLARARLGMAVFPKPSPRDLRLLRLLDRTLDEAKSAAQVAGVSAMPPSAQEIEDTLARWVNR